MNLRLEKANSNTDPTLFFEVLLPACAVPLRFRWSAIESLQGRIESQAIELVGWLLGLSTSEAVWIERFEPIQNADVFAGFESARSNAVATLVSSSLQEIPGGMTVLGSFRTQTSGWMELKDPDRDLATSGSVFLLIRTSSHRSWGCLPFIWDHQTGLLSEQREFELDKRRCSTESAAMKALMKEQQMAVAEYKRISQYLKSARDILTDPDRSLLSEFANLAKRRYERLLSRNTKNRT